MGHFECKFQTEGALGYDVGKISAECLVFRIFEPSSFYASEMIVFHRVETCVKLFEHYFRGLLQLVYIFQHVQCH